MTQQRALRTFVTQDQNADYGFFLSVSQIAFPNKPRQKEIDSYEDQFHQKIKSTRLLDMYI